MVLVSALLLGTCVLALAGLAVTKSGELLILATYPDSDNFSSIELSCVHDMFSGPQTEGIGAKFQLNGTDIKEQIEEVEDFTNINGTVHFVLTPEKEGFFTCSLNGSLSINSIGLAAQPTTDYSGQSMTHEVELPDDDSSVSTELQCDIQPGALRQRYSVQWVQVFNIGFTTIAVDIYNLTLSVNSSTSVSLYQCCVSINHNSSGLTLIYKGRLIVLITTEEIEPNHESNYTWVIILLSALLAVIGCTFFCGTLTFTVSKFWRAENTQLRMRALDEEEHSVPNQVHCQETVIHENLSLASDSISHQEDSFKYQRMRDQFQEEHSHITTSNQIHCQETVTHENLSLTSAPVYICQGRRFTEVHEMREANNEDMDTLTPLSFGHEDMENNIRLEREDYGHKILSHPENSDETIYIGRERSNADIQSPIMLPNLIINQHSTRDLEYNPEWFDPMAELSQCSHNRMQAMYYDEHYSSPLWSRADLTSGPSKNQAIANTPEFPETDLEQIQPPSFGPLAVEQNATPNMDTQSTHEKAPIPKAGPTIGDSGSIKALSQHIVDVLGKEDQSHETQIFLPTFFPHIDADNTIGYIPACFTPMATLSQCTHDGRSYYDEHNDFGLDIPAGAIPEGESITIDIGVALYGPFQYPEGLRPVSPVFWVCVRDHKDFQFLKPVKITIPHCLNLKQYDDIESLGLTFLKGYHQMNSQRMYQFRQEGNIHIEPLKKYGVIQTTHFCSLCISCEDTLKFFEKAVFCMCSVIPEMFLPNKSSHAYFFITLLLQTCLTTVENQIEELGYKEKQQDEFQIGSDQTLEIFLSQSLPSDWKVGMRGKKKIMISEVDFFVKDFCEDTKHKLELREKRGMYPPRFHVVISCSSCARQSQTRIEFNVTDLVFDIILTPDPCPRGVSISSSTSEKDGLLGFSSIHEKDRATTTQLGIDNLFDVTSELEDVAVNWRDIGLALRLHDPDLGAIDTGGKSVYGCLKDMLRLWLNQSYDVIKYGEPSWQTLENAIRDRAGGNNPAVADQIHRKYIINS